MSGFKTGNERRKLKKQLEDKINQRKNFKFQQETKTKLNIKVCSNKKQ